jgi:hypothetical protein
MSKSISVLKLVGINSAFVKEPNKAILVRQQDVVQMDRLHNISKHKDIGRCQDIHEDFQI